MHCFTGSKEFAKKLIDLNCFISVSGIITFKNSTELAETVSALVASLERDLSNSFEIAERLENHWLVSNIDIFTTLREHFRLLPPTLYYKASNAIDRCETRLKHYGSASLAFVELILNLRKITR